MQISFSCVECGATFQAYPPDHLHGYASRQENRVIDAIKVTYKLPCEHDNIIYWGHEIKPE